MWLKAIIVLLFLAVLASLTSALVFLLRDMGAPESKRTLYALGIRVGLAALLLFAIWYGFDSGQLANTAPWADKY
ncbi:DUF2909 domain-containing protein [Microbulbifer sp. SA54]|uniref:DUF2909 domain-containing protein n=1 Tax=Microbulbifer sp. SA54 TaxID=3401577 RepID=UPI003AAAC50E